MTKTKNSRVPQKKEGKTLQKSYLFPKLAIEVRLTIWNLARPGPQVVKCGKNKYDETKEMRKIQTYDTRPYNIKFSAKIPAMLHVNRESRLETQKWYTKCFEAQLNGYVYMDLLQDTLLFEDPCAMRVFFGLQYKLDDVLSFYTLQGTGQDMDIPCKKLQHLGFRDWEILRDGLYYSIHSTTAVVEQISKFLNLDDITILRPKNSKLSTATKNKIISNLIGGLNGITASATPITKVPKEDRLVEELYESNENLVSFKISI